MAYKSIDGLLLSKNGSTLVSGINGDVIIPDGVQKIGVNAFTHRGGLTSVSIPGSVQTIGDNSFSYCSSLTNVTISYGSTVIDWHAFGDCENLKCIEIPDSVISIRGIAFKNCRNLEKIVLPQRFEGNLDMSNFEGCPWDIEIVYREPSRVNVTFDANGGVGGNTCILGCGSSMAAPTVWRTGYTFAGWQPNVPSTVPSEDATYVAQWSVNSYTLYFDSTGGTEVDPVRQNYGMPVATPAEPTKEGYAFKGWLPDVPETMPAENMIFEAQWESLRYVVTLHFGGGDGRSIA